jgi:shikimate kinase
LQETVTVTARDTLEWLEQEAGTGEVQTALTMRGLLVQQFGQELGTSIHADILSTEDQIFSWATRGPKLFNRIMNCNFDAGNGVHGSGSVDSGGHGVAGGDSAVGPSLVALQEYDSEELQRADYGYGTVRVVRQKSTLEDAAIDSHTPVA